MTDLNKERELYMAAKARIEKEEFFCRDWDLWKACAELKQAEINELRAELEKAKAKAVPEGYVLVPKEPTEVMERAGFDKGAGFLANSIYKAMVEASESGAEG
ncbi:hypothetical protein ABTD92_17945 [Acinetobacter baumannii]|uniref:hypothetical protein n=1 Tax=Acinetobacter baumannii TaxID=470 RepID=UPI000571E482|nr:hypothetical protein [Acinetobacter baumannii]EHU1514740.1 hypothetical protein [Acinetobacter baumannii]EHU1805630.1 hypothetical protein [Acinetobacter baumannii]MBL1350839.1 hypothetical protein [Acinetobacter baumannii]MBO2841495.1 hypothetical protein [Acinetobacter baumannii]UQM62451.1 hypothetical protein M1S35_13800 [Acinetobacter baumannii]